jgi:photosystem II stability/assembly factor-like uncharacterized protein
VIALVRTDGGTFAVDLDEDEAEPWHGELPDDPPLVVLNLPRLVAAAVAGATVFAVVDARPPLLVSHDAGSTWRASGHGLPRGRAIAVAEESPDLAVYGARNRLYVTHDGGRFWRGLAVELPEIEAVWLREA